jgi:hypothetical protein
VSELRALRGHERRRPHLHRQEPELVPDLEWQLTPYVHLRVPSRIS